MKDIISHHRSGERIGICSVCSAHLLAIKAALRFDLSTSNKVLIEATSNQVNQFGGYTGMQPTNFRDFIYNIARTVGFPAEYIIPDGDHPGPNCWQDEPAAVAMERSVDLVRAYITAGFSKIHLDASTSCTDNPVPLDPGAVVGRTARLCQVAEEIAGAEQKRRLTYIIGTEVPVPGGEAGTIGSVHVTQAQDATATLKTHEAASRKLELEAVLERVIAIVMQPGVEFDHTQAIRYQPQEVKALSIWIESTPMAYEAHSTDCQARQAYRALVRGHFAILKVGPALIFVLREAIFVLAQMENELVALGSRSRVIEVIDEVMLNEPSYWKKYYRPTWSQAMVDTHFGLSDRICYYWPHLRIHRSVEKLIANLTDVKLSLGLTSQYMPVQFEQLSLSTLNAEPYALVLDKIQDVLRVYRYGCSSEIARS